MLAFKRGLVTVWKDWLRSLLIIVLIVTSFRSAVADWNDVPTGSMKPTIMEGDRIVVNKLAYDLKVPYTTWRLASWGAPKRGEIVVLFSPSDGKRLVKRAVGIAGDEISMRNNCLIVNGEPATYSAIDAEAVSELKLALESRVLATEQVGPASHSVMLTPNTLSLRSFGPITIPPGHYFVMGDNRDQSLDSRHFGMVTRASIIGRATAVAASVDPSDHFQPRWSRFFQALR